MPEAAAAGTYRKVVRAVAIKEEINIAWGILNMSIGAGVVKVTV